MAEGGGEGVEFLLVQVNDIGWCELKVVRTSMGLVLSGRPLGVAAIPGIASGRAPTDIGNTGKDNNEFLIVLPQLGKFRGIFVIRNGEMFWRQFAFAKIQRNCKKIEQLLLFFFDYGAFVLCLDLPSFAFYPE